MSVFCLCGCVHFTFVYAFVCDLCNLAAQVSEKDSDRASFVFLAVKGCVYICISVRACVHVCVVGSGCGRGLGIKGYGF